MREFDGAVAAMVNEVLEDAEEAYASRRREEGGGRIILTESRQFVAAIDGINAELECWQNPGAGPEGRRWSLMIASWDLSRGKLFISDGSWAIRLKMVRT